MYTVLTPAQSTPLTVTLLLDSGANWELLSAHPYILYPQMRTPIAAPVKRKTWREMNVIIRTEVCRLHHERRADNSFRQKADDVHCVQRAKSTAIDVITNSFY